MKFAKAWWILAFLLLPAAAAGRQANSSGNDLHSEIQRVYNFQPHTLNHDQTMEKSALLDQFWNKAKSQRDVYVPGLRRELADFSNPVFFLFDGSKLLMNLSSDPGDRKIILAAIAHSDLRDLQLKDYFLLVQYMAAEGEDTTVAAFHILAEPKFEVFVPEHSLTLAQNYCLVYMLLPTNQDFWIQPAIDRLRAEKDVTAQKSLLLVLWYGQTPASDKTILDFAEDATKTRDSRDYAIKLVRQNKEGGAKMGATAAKTSEESLRRARREQMKAVSDEALYDLDSYTAKIIAKRK